MTKIEPYSDDPKKNPHLRSSDSKKYQQEQLSLNKSPGNGSHYYTGQ